MSICTGKDKENDGTAMPRNTLQPEKKALDPSSCTDNIHKARANGTKVKAEHGLDVAIRVKMKMRWKRRHVYISPYVHKIALARCAGNSGRSRKGTWEKGFLLQALL